MCTEPAALPDVTRHYESDQIAVATRVIHNTRYIIDDALMERCIALDKLPLVKLERGLNGTNVELNTRARNKQIKNRFFNRTTAGLRRRGHSGLALHLDRISLFS